MLPQTHLSLLSVSWQGRQHCADKSTVHAKPCHGLQLQPKGMREAAADAELGAQRVAQDRGAP